jgi:hypothetical protein
LPRSGGSAHGSADDLPFKLPPKYLFTCTVGRSMASRARWVPSGWPAAWASLPLPGCCVLLRVTS